VDTFYDYSFVSSFSMNNAIQVAIGTAFLNLGGDLGLTPPLGELDLEQESDPTASLPVISAEDGSPPTFIGEDGTDPSIIISV
jgi:hypothetical protein